MNSLAAHSYFIVKREIKDFQQLMIEEERIIYLYAEKIVTKHHEFPIQIVFDISYREMGVEGGILYLHTSRGVYSYNVKSSPEKFIEAYKKIL